MKKWITYIKAIDPKTQELCLWMGPNVDGETIEDAQNFCDKNGLGYCKVDSVFIAELDENLKSFASVLLDKSINN